MNHVICLITMVYTCLLQLMILILLPSLHLAHIITVCNNVIYTEPFNILFDNSPIVLNYTTHFVYSPLKSLCLYTLGIIIIITHVNRKKKKS